MNRLAKKLYKKIPIIREKYVYKRKIKSILKEHGLITAKLDKAYSRRIEDFWAERHNIKINRKWHLAYSSINEKLDVRYIPEDFFYTKVEPTLNRVELAPAFKDKNMYHVYLGDYPAPYTILKNVNKYYLNNKDEIIERKNAETILNNEKGDFFIKPSIDSGGGRSVNLLNIKNGTIYLSGKIVTLENLERLYNCDFIIQKKISQYKPLSQVYPYAINTIRITSMKMENKVIILSNIIRFGNYGNVIDNGGIACGINFDGCLNKIAIDKNGHKYDKHPYTKESFNELKIPYFDKIHELIRKLHFKLHYFNLVSWDVALDKNGNPIVLEMNLYGQEINFHQFNNGPLFGEYTEEVLKLVKKTASKNEV